MIDLKHIPVLRSLALTVSLLCAGILYPQSVPAEKFQISLENGSLIGVEVKSSSVPWLNVLADGNTSEQRIALADIRELVLISNPVSEKLGQVKELLQNLGSEDYAKREEAERQLSDPEFSGNMTSVIRETRKTADLETSIRIERILWELNDFEQDLSDDLSGPMDLDLLVLRDGTELRGDAQGLEIDCRFRNQDLTIPREQILRVGYLPEPRSTVGSGVATVKTFNQPDGFYNSKNETLVDFETDPFGNPLSLRDDLHETYHSRGLLTFAQPRGYISSVRYRFKLCPLKIESKKSGAVVYGDSRFRGIAGFRFCLPGQPNAPAGVNRFGVFIERVDHSRDIIVEAYGDLGQILGMVEATDQKCVFAGFESNVPIAQVRILQNPMLTEKDVGRDIDQLFAFDNITFSQPVPIQAFPVPVARISVRLKNGDVFSPAAAENLQINKNLISIPSPVDDGGSLKLPIDEIDSILLSAPGSSTSKTDQSIWMVMLQDQSILRVRPSAGFESTDFNGLKIAQDKIVGLWPADQPARYPVAGDFGAGKPLVVFASCRIEADNLKISETGIAWNPESQKIVQDVNIDPLEGQANAPEKPDPDLTPQFSEVEFDSGQQRPTVWLEAPRVDDHDGPGQLVLKDGQQLVLGGTTGFRLEDLNTNLAVVSINGQQRQIPFSAIASIVFPTSKQE